jgi:hypothetical protein
MKNKSWYVWTKVGDQRDLHVFSVLRRPYHRLVTYSNPVFSISIARKEAAYALRRLRVSTTLDQIELHVSEDPKID